MGDQGDRAQSAWYANGAARVEAEAAARPETASQEGENGLNNNWPASEGENGLNGHDWSLRLNFEPDEAYLVQDQLAFAYVLGWQKEHAEPPQVCKLHLHGSREWIFEVRCPLGTCRSGHRLIAKRATWEEAIATELWHLLVDPQHGIECYVEAADACERNWPTPVVAQSEELQVVASENGLYFKHWEPEPEAAGAASSSGTEQAVNAARQTFEQLMQQIKGSMAARGQDVLDVVEVPKYAIEGVLKGLERASSAIAAAEGVSHHCSHALQSEQKVIGMLKEQLLEFLAPQEPQAKRARRG